MPPAVSPPGLAQGLIVRHAFAFWNHTHPCHPCAEDSRLRAPCEVRRGDSRTRCTFGAPHMIHDALRIALQQALATAGLPQPPGGIVLEPPKHRDHGDWATPVAMAVAKQAGRKNPREVAGEIQAALEAAEVAHLAAGGDRRSRLRQPLPRPDLAPGRAAPVVDEADRYGTSDALAGRRINLEFVSANPTGPLHAGGGRWVAVGDAIANLLAAQGAEVHREYYLNDAGNQLGTFRDSLYARYQGESPPEDGYQGQYLVDMAAQLRAELGDDVDARRRVRVGLPEHRGGAPGGPRPHRRALRHLVLGAHVARTRRSRATCSQTSTTRGVTYENDGAQWLRATDFGDNRDRVLVRSDGTTTYLCNDLAYHRDKFARGFTHLIDIWGADHHGQVKSLQAGMQALGFPPGEPEILLGQFVKLVKHGQEVRISKRTGQHHHARRHPRRGRSRRRAHDVPPAGHRLAADVRSRRRHCAVDGEPRLLRAVRARAHRVDRTARPRRRVSHVGRSSRVDLSLLTHEREEELLRALAVYPERRRRGGRDARAAEGHHVGARLRARVPRLLPRLPGALVGRRGAHPGAAVAHRGVPHRAGQRARPARRARARRDGAPRRRRREPDA